MKNMAAANYIFLVLISFLLCACTSFQVDHSQPINLSAGQRIAVLPFANYTETPQADERAQSIGANLLRSHGLINVGVYHQSTNKPALIPGIKSPVSRQKLLAWAKELHASVALTGGVTEWNYKVGLDGEPAVGLNLELIDVRSGSTIWSAVGSKSGGSRTALSDVAIDLLGSMLNSIHVIKAA